MEFGLMVEPQVGGSYTQLLELARWAEDRGLTVFARSDHYLLPGKHPQATDALVSLAGLARETRDIDLAVLVSPISFRHPSTIAKMAATIDQMSEGRFVLGVGTGWMEAEHEAFGLDLWPLTERFARLEEALQYLRAAFTPGEASFRGEYYSLEGIDVHPKPARLPIVVGGGGPRRTQTLAGRFADEFNRFIDPPEVMAGPVKVMRAAARDAGRDPADILVSTVGPLPVYATAAEYENEVAATAAARGSTPEEIEERRASRGIPRGTPDAAGAAFSAMEDAGIDRYYIQMFEPLSEIDTARLDEGLTLVGF